MEQLRIPSIPQFDILVEYFKQELSLKDLASEIPDLNVLDFYCWLAVKQEVYGSRSRNLQESRENSRQQIDAIRHEEIHRMFENMRR